MPAYVGNPLAGDPICEASSASELRIAITTKQVSRAGHPSDLLVARSTTRRLLSLRMPTSASRALPWTLSSVRLKTIFGIAHQTSANAASSSLSRIDGSVSHTSIVS
jgi:hypothetical protein